MKYCPSNKIELSFALFTISANKWDFPTPASPSNNKNEKEDKNKTTYDNESNEYNDKQDDIFDNNTSNKEVVKWKMILSVPQQHLRQAC